MLLNLYDSILDDETKFCGKLVLSYFFRSVIKNGEEESDIVLNPDTNGDLYDDRACWEGLENWKTDLYKFVTPKFHDMLNSSNLF